MIRVKSLPLTVKPVRVRGGRPALLDNLRSVSLKFGLSQRVKERSNYLAKTARVHCRVVHTEVIGYVFLTTPVHVHGRVNLAIAIGFARLHFEEAWCQEPLTRSLHPRQACPKCFFQ